MRYILVELINFYQKWLSFDTGLLKILAPNGACKHTPRCSEYAKEQIIKYGSLSGSLLGLKRILSCW